MAPDAGLFPQPSSSRLWPLLELEKSLREEGFTFVAGVDEAGRGALAGPVVAAAVILPPDFDAAGLDDSKKVDPRRRLELFDTITQQAVAWKVGVVSARYVDRYNVLTASLEAMRRAAERLEPAPHMLLVDGNQPVPTLVRQKTIVKGDGRCACIAAASILAKVRRDRFMDRLHALCPQYGFNAHKGYGTAEHVAAILRHGVSRFHRRTFKPIAAMEPEDDTLFER